jgi:Gpi18-like mannosyltransferase
MDLRSGKNLHWSLLILVFILLIVISFLSEGFYGGADNVTHYFISRYSFKYPHLFLEPWGKPVFTIMASPFCQFGFQGLKVFNVLLGCLSAFLAFLTARKIGIDRAWLAILFVIFTPMYFLMTLTGLTEIQFGFILVLSVYLFFDEKYIASAIIISFIPLSRSEGFALIPIFLVALLIKRKYIAIPFLISGLLFFSILGYFFVWKDFFWIFTHSPYPLHHPLYKEKGPLLHFINSSPEIFGMPLLILFLAGLVIYGYLFFRSGKEQRVKVFLEIWMLVIPVLLFFAVHSILYWKALFASIGLIRVITGVLPLAAIVSLKAYGYLEKRFIKIVIFRKVFLFMVIVLIILFNFHIHRFPVPLSPGEEALKKAINWTKQSPLINHKILFTDPSVPFLLGLDPRDHKKCEQIFTAPWLTRYPHNTVFIWDSYFSIHECFVPLDSIEKTHEYRLVNYFRPKLPREFWYDPDYEICIFMKVPYASHFDNKAIRDSITAKNNEPCEVKFITGDTFEKNPKKNDNPHASAEVARSGSWSYKTSSWEQFALPYELDLSTIISQNKNVNIRVTCYIYPLIPFKENDTRLVITLKNKNEYYHSLPLDSVATRINQWNKVSFKVTFPLIKSSDRLVVYFWHLGKKEFYIDDLKIESVVP